MLMWSVRQLATASGISDSSIRRIESEFGVPENVSLDLLERLREFYEGKGFHFVFEDPHGPGIHWLRKERRRAANDRRGGGGGGGGDGSMKLDDADLLASVPWIF
jgi:transcriptional regulator with XRE-family HTH domain